MDRINVLMKVFIDTFSGCSGHLLSVWDTTVKISVMMLFIDYLTSMIEAGYKGELKSKIGFKGIYQKGSAFSFSWSGSSIRYSVRKRQFSSLWIISCFRL